MKKSYLKRLICLGAAAFVLCSALAVAAMIGSPYEVLKDAAFKGFEITNGTIDARLDVTVDGVSAGNDSFSEKRYISETADLTESSDGNFSYTSEEFAVNSWYGYEDDMGDWYNAYTGREFYSNSFSLSPSESMSSAERRFSELLLDFLVGDLKNNLSMREEDGTRYISGSLTSVQIPELANAALDLYVHETDGYLDFRDAGVDGIPQIKKLRVSSVHGDARVDSDGNLTAVSGELKFNATDVNDAEHEIVLSLSLNITDVGTTVAQCPIPGVKELLDGYRNESHNFTDVRFKLNEDGTIDKESVFDNMNMSSEVYGNSVVVE